MIEELEKNGEIIQGKIRQKLEIAGQIYEQQKKMYTEKVNRVKDKVLSLVRPYVRPIVRGKSGKEVGFGSKA